MQKMRLLIYLNLHYPESRNKFKTANTRRSVCNAVFSCDYLTQLWNTTDYTVQKVLVRFSQASNSN